MFEKILKNRNWLTLILSVFIFLLVYVFSNSNVTYLVDKKIQNKYYSIKNNYAGITASKDIIVLQIDEKTLGKLGRFPFDRKKYVPVIENLKEAGAAVVAFDIIFVDDTSTESDKALGNAIKEADNVVVGLSLGSDGAIEKPHPLIRESLKNSGYFRPNVDRHTETVYSITPYASFKDRVVYNHFSLGILKAYYAYIYNKDYSKSPSVVRDNHFYLTPSISMPLSREVAPENLHPDKKKASVLINFIDRSHFQKASFIDVYDTERFKGLQNQIDFKDKIVIIGATAKGIKDTFLIPSGSEFGVYIHANMVNTILTKSYLSYFDTTIEWTLIFLLIVLSVYFNLSRAGRVLIASNVAIVTIFLVIFPYSVILLTSLIINYPIELLIALVVSLTLSNIVKYVVENKYKNKLNKALSEYVSKDIAAEIMMGHGKINLDGEGKDIAIFFSDIEGFTTISEQFTPDKLVAFLRDYLGEMSNIIMDEKGFINKYEGDAIMALWGVFGQKENDAYNACKSALLQHSKLDYLNHLWGDNFAEIKARIGIHTGRAIIGNIGATGRKMEFTALGDSVNLASRLEGVNKFYGTYICVSEDVYEQVKDDFAFRYLDKIRVKGKNKPVVIYELLAFKDQLLENKKNIVDKFLEAINLYNQRNFEAALEIFIQLEKDGDSPSKTYKNRCENYIQNPPDAQWDGVWNMVSK